MVAGGASADASQENGRCNRPDVICITSDQTELLDITTSNITIDGQGHTAVGARVMADNVTLVNFRFENCAGWCVWLQGENNTLRDSDISQVYYDPEVSDDVDAMRFFGDGTRIIDNVFHDIVAGEDNEDAHLDCMQTYATPNAGGGSSNVLIRGNTCDSPEFHQCVMAEGPNSTDGGGGGGGVSRNWVIQNNYFACYANQTIKVDDIHNVLIVNNEFAGAGRKAIATGDLSTNVWPVGNVLGPGYEYLIGD